MKVYHKIKIPVFIFNSNNHLAHTQDIFLTNLRKLYRREESKIDVIRNMDLSLVTLENLDKIIETIKQAKSDSIYSNKDINPVDMII